jgi:HD-GYP domain-containing protein (c-di-GMP phosphodiesterase class II)
MRVVKDVLQPTQYTIDYREVTLKILNLFERAPVDIYIKMSDAKYLKIINIEEEGFENTLNKYQMKGIETFYVLASSFQFIFERAVEILRDKMQENELLKNEKIFRQISSIEAIGNYLHNCLGVGEEVVALFHRVNESVIEDLKNGPSLKGLLDNMVTGDGYISQHSLMLSYVSCALCRETSWKSDQTYQKLSMASLMHDVDFQDDELAYRHDMFPPGVINQNPEFLDEIKSHPLRASKLVNKLPVLQPDVEAIILNQHERPDGSGYPRGIDFSQFSQISALFNLAHEYVLFLFRNELNASGSEYFLRNARPFYTKGNFKSAFEALEKFVSLQL